MARKISYSPSLFGSNTAQQAWQIISKIIGYPEDVPIVPGLAPEMEYVFKTRLQKNRDKILKSLKITPQQRKRDPFALVGRDMSYEPEAIMILAYLFMRTGAYLTSNMRQDIRRAIHASRERAKSLSGRNKTQRNKQLNHLEKKLNSYDNTPTMVLLFHTKKGRKRAQGADRKRRKKRQSAQSRLQLSPQNITRITEAYLIMRVMYGVKKANSTFETICPGIPLKSVLQSARSNGWIDEKNRVNRYFNGHIKENFLER